MILSDYYRFEKTALKSKTRLDCVASTESYTELEEKRQTNVIKESAKRDAINIGDLLVYLGDVPNNFKGDAHRKADKSITIKGKNISSVFVPDPKNSLAYGDFQGTTDALLFVFTNFSVVDGRIQYGSVMEIFIARGQNTNRVALYTQLDEGYLDDEVETLRKSAKPNYRQDEQSQPNPIGI